MSPPIRSLFLGHGAPTLATSTHPAADVLRDLGQRLRRPRAVVVVSPHRQEDGFNPGSAPRFSAWHDFGGFAPELYTLRYDVPGEPALAAAVQRLIAEAGLPSRLSTDARIDHGIWVPLRLMWPDADVPIVPLAQGGANPRAHHALGRALRPLAERDVLVIGSGSITHNLGDLDRGDEFAPPAPWAQAFDDWVAQALDAHNTEALLDYRKRAPRAAHAHPSEEHLLPLFVALGSGDTAQTLYRGFSHASLSLSAYAFQ